MKELLLPEGLVRELEEIYSMLQQEYSKVASELDFSCDGCPDNCCDSYFLHYTYAEWAYLWLGVNQLDPKRKEALINKAKLYLDECERARAVDERPEVMCPINEDGLCVLYQHRLLVCRTHGVPATMTRPDGQTLRFPGCFRCQEIIEVVSDSREVPFVARTALLQKLARLENDLLQNRRHLLPKIRMTIAEMLVKGPPALPELHCEQPGYGRGEDAKCK
ncbi:MAG: hypothetical protein ACN4GW_05795 [Desulforhopalus sp.]